MDDQQKHLIERIRSGHIQLHRQIVQLIADLDARLAAAEAREDSLTQNWLRTQESLAAADADQQRAVDAALEHVAGLFDRVGKRDEAAFLRSWRGTNPLSEAQARIAELDKLCAYHEQIEADIIAQLAELNQKLAELELANKNLLNQINDGITHEFTGG